MRTAAGNLVQVAQTVGQNMTNISNIGVKTGTLDKRGASLPPRNLKPPSPRKTFTGRHDTTKSSNYQRLEESSNTTKKRSLLPMPKISTSTRANSSTLGNSNSRASPMHFEPNYVSIHRSPSPAQSRHAHFILGHPPSQQQQSMKSASLDRQESPSARKSSLSGRSVNRYRIQF